MSEASSVPSQSSSSVNANHSNLFVRPSSLGGLTVSTSSSTHTTSTGSAKATEPAVSAGAMLALMREEMSKVVGVLKAEMKSEL